MLDYDIDATASGLVTPVLTVEPATQAGYSTPSAEKRFATVRTRLALAGWTLTSTGRDAATSRLVAGRRGRTCPLATLTHAEAFALKVEAPL